MYLFDRIIFSNNLSRILRQKIVLLHYIRAYPICPDT